MLPRQTLFSTVLVAAVAVGRANADKTEPCAQISQIVASTKTHPSKPNPAIEAEIFVLSLFSIPETCLFSLH
ncbi:hypothetical protein F5884DRAFT_799231 [Xylogone sp. PMI_703]|nr:hypothetical protein F5884DRAFT_799231 [Xylogone sp. PMI_703]